jgi:ABC-2 type transport system ATP-binding protein
MKSTGGMQLVLCSHLLRDVEETCDEVLILKKGRIVHHANLDLERRSDKRFVDVETFGNDSGFADALVRLGCECEVARSGRFKLILPPGFDLDEIYRLAAESELQLRHLSYRRDTLEDIFLKAMET